MEKNEKIFIAGHNGLVGSNLYKYLKSLGFTNLITSDKSELNLINQNEVDSFFKQNNINYVFLCAAKVGGILFNKEFQADFLYENLMISANVIKASNDFGVKKLLYLGSSCIYPKNTHQPIHESQLLTGKLEETNEGYALAKIAGLKLCEKYRLQYNKDFFSVMPTNLYGFGDSFHSNHSHVIPGLLRRFHEAKINGSNEVTIWGTGNPRREFLFIEDLVRALLIIMEQYNENSPINVGYGEDISIKELAFTIKEVTEYSGDIIFDPSKPDGTFRKILNISKIENLGWKPEVMLKQGLKLTYEWAKENIFKNTLYS